MSEGNNLALISSALRAMRDETAYTAYAGIALKELERVGEALLAAEAEVERLRDVVRQVHAMTGRGVDWAAFPGVAATALREIHKLTEGEE